MNISKTKKTSIGVAAFVAAVLVFNATHVCDTPDVITEIVYSKGSEPFSEEKLIAEISKYNFRHPEIVLAQAKLETGNFSSSLFLENNNLFGMKVARSRPTTAIGEAKGHAVYKSWQESLNDYALYSSAFLRYRDQDDVFAHLGRHYAEDPVYEKKVRQVASTLDSEIFTPR